MKKIIHTTLIGALVLLGVIVLLSGVIWIGQFHWGAVTLTLIGLAGVFLVISYMIGIWVLS